MGRPLSSRPAQPQIALAILREDEIAVIRAGFWARVDTSGGPDGCWPWLGHVQGNGYGKASYGRQRAGQAHRLSYELNVSPIPPDLDVCHDCPGGDRRDCVNPRHLWLGTATDNMRDAVAKGTIAKGDRHGSRTQPDRVARGVRHGMAKVDESSVREIRRLVAAGAPQREAGGRFGLSQRAVSRIVHRETWGHVR